MTWEPLSNILADDPDSCAVYAKKFNLINTQGWMETTQEACQNSKEVH